MTASQTVTRAVARLFGDRDPAAIDEFFGPVYRQHSALGADGTDGLRGLLERLPSGFGYELVRVVGEGDLAVTQGVYTGFGPAPVVGFDVWRVEGDRIVEHWDALGPLGGAAPDDRSPLDGPREPSDLGRTKANRDLVRAFVERVLLEGEHTALGEFVGEDSIDHAGAGAAIGIPTAPTGDPLPYVALHQLIAEGDLVYTRAEGGDEPGLILNDLWRVADGRIVEHWGLVAPVPAQLPHGNGAF